MTKARLFTSILVLMSLLSACGSDNVTPLPATTSSGATTTAVGLQTATLAVSSPATTASPTLAITTVPASPTRVAPSATPVPDPKLPYLVIGDPARGGSLREPRDGVIDSDGNLFVADYITHKVIKFDKNYQFRQAIQFDTSKSDPGGPSYLALDPASNLYVVYNSGEVFIFDKNGKQIGPFGDNELGGVYSIAIDKTGNIYTVTTQDYLVKYSPDGKVTNQFKATKKTGDKLDNGQFDYTAKVRVGADGSIYLFEQYDPARVQKFDPAMKFIRSYDIPKQKDDKPSQLTDVVPDAQGNLQVFNYEHLWNLDKAGKLLSDTPLTLYSPQRILPLQAGGYVVIGSASNETGKLDLAAGKIQSVIGRSNADQPGQFEQARSIVVDKAGNFFVGDPFQSRIQKFDKTGQVVLTIDNKIAGPDFSPSYLALDQSGNIYAAGGASVVKLDPTGHQILNFGKSGKDDGQFENMSGLALDNAGNIYVGESQRGVIQKFNSAGAYQTKYTIKESEKDVVNSISMAFDRAGNLYVGRGYSNGIVVLNPNGTIQGHFSPNNKLVSEAGIYSLVLDASGTIYAVTSSNKQPVLIIRPDGQVKGSYGGEGIQTLQFLNLQSIAVDEAGNLYLADADGARVQRWYPGDPAVKIGSPLVGLSGSVKEPTPVSISTSAAPVSATTVTSQNHNGVIDLNSIRGQSQGQLDPAFASGLAGALPGVSGLAVKLYVSDESADQTATDFDKAITDGGYNRLGEVTSQGATKVGVYAKSGQPDIILSVLAVSDDPQQLIQSAKFPGVGPAALQQLAGQVKGKKSGTLVISGQDLIKTLTGGSVTPGGTVPVSNPNNGTVASSSSTALAGESDIPVYPGAKKIDGPSGRAGNITAIYYLSSDDASKISGWAKAAFADKGWTNLTQVEVGGTTIISGQKDKSKLNCTILGSAARGNANYDPIFKQATAGPGDSVIFVIIANT